MKVNLENKVAIITGAGGGIGSGMARLFAQNGAMVVVNDIAEDRGQQVVEEIRAASGQAIFIKADVGNRQEVQAMADRVAGEFGKIDILINNAGINISINARKPIHEFPDEMWEKILHVDLDGVYYCSKAVLKYMSEKHYAYLSHLKIAFLGNIG